MQIDWNSFAIGSLVGLVLSFLLRLSELYKLNLKLEQIGFSLGVEGFRRRPKTSSRKIVGNVGGNFGGQAAAGSIGGTSTTKRSRRKSYNSSDLQVVGDVSGDFTGQAAGQDIHQSQTIKNLNQDANRDITHKQFAGRDINQTSNLYQTVQAAAREVVKGRGKDSLRINKPITFRAVISNMNIKPDLKEALHSKGFDAYVEYVINLPEFRHSLQGKIIELQTGGWQILELRAVDQIESGLLVEFMVEKLFDISN